MTGVTFRADSEMDTAAVEFAEQAVRIAQEHFGRGLDYSPTSIAIVEEILVDMHEQRAELSEKRAFQLGVLFGSYLGEVLRRGQPGGWGHITAPDGSQFAGLRLDNSDTLIWPWARVQQRILEGEEHEVVHYFLSFL